MQAEGLYLRLIDSTLPTGCDLSSVILCGLYMKNKIKHFVSLVAYRRGFPHYTNKIKKNRHFTFIKELMKHKVNAPKTVIVSHDGKSKPLLIVYAADKFIDTS